jgi:hypothetical protein
MDTKQPHQINPNPFKKKEADSNAKTKDIFAHGSGGGGGGRVKPSTNTDPEPLGEEQTPMEPPKAEQKKKPEVRLFNPKWAVEKVGFGEKAKFSVEGDLPEESKHLTRVTFTLFAKLPDGKKERIDGNEAHLMEGKAEQVERPKCNDTPDPAAESDLGKCP